MLPNALDSLPALNCPSILLLYFQTLCDKICCQKFEIKGILVMFFKIWVIRFQRLFSPNQAFPPSPPIFNVGEYCSDLFSCIKNQTQHWKGGKGGNWKQNIVLWPIFREFWQQFRRGVSEISLQEKNCSRWLNTYQIVSKEGPGWKKSHMLVWIILIMLTSFDDVIIAIFMYWKRVQIFDIEAFLPHLTSNLHENEINNILITSNDRKGNDRLPTKILAHKFLFQS